VGHAVSIFKDHQCCEPPAFPGEARNNVIMVADIMRRRFPLKLIALSLVAFGMGGFIDSYLRANVGPTCFGCNNLTCKIVGYADNPRLVVSHPVEVIQDLFSQ